MKLSQHRTTLLFTCICLVALTVCLLSQSAAAEINSASCQSPFQFDQHRYDFQSAGLTDDIIGRILKIFRAIVQAVIDLQCKIYRLFGFRCG
ncbi:MAG: hypothetical protein K1X79_00735 [Oligoflexia bacterium]|nr:hypothetical protein [Oligoflexia bacterium]